jgi:hypothetical protein
MKYFRFFMFLILLLLSGNAFAAGGKSSVAFVNNSEKLLSCSIQTEKDYIPFIRLQSGSSKRFENFKLASQVRCQTEVDKTERSSTFITYFSVNTEGEYELLQERVPCESCPSKIRWATIVVFPNGEAHYTKWK